NVYLPASETSKSNQKQRYSVKIGQHILMNKLAHGFITANGGLVPAFVPLYDAMSAEAFQYERKVSHTASVRTLISHSFIVALATPVTSNSKNSLLIPPVTPASSSMPSKL